MARPRIDLIQPYAESRLERLRYLQSLHVRAAKVKTGAARYYHDPLGFLADCIDWRDGGGPTFYQRDIIAGIPQDKRVSVRGPHGLGKALALDTPLPAPAGWTTMGEVRAGDYLLDADGKPTRVVAATEVMHGRPCYEVGFSDGTVITADENHQWQTWRRPGERESASLVTTGEIAGSPLHHAVALTHTADLPGGAPQDTRWRFITGARPVLPRPVRCVQVDNENGLYLAGRGMIPTHNSSISAWVILWFALTRDAAGVDWKVATTAGSWHQISRFLWPEIHKWVQRVRWDQVRAGRRPTEHEELNLRLRGHPFSPSQLMNLNLRLNHGAAFASASANSALIEGAHADSLLFIFDEAKAIPAATFDACEGALNGTGEAFAMALSTPGAPNGRFYDIQSRKPGYEDWHARHVTLDQAIEAGQISAEWAEQRRRQWGENSAIYQNRVRGEFYASDEDSVIPLAWAEAAVARWHEWEAAGKPDTGRPRTVGVDVARFGTDKTVLAVRDGPVITELRRYTREDTMQTTGRVKGVLDADTSRTAVVDVIGIGAGVVDRLREQRALVVAFNASRASKAKDHTRELGFFNRRSEAWWHLREALDPSASPDICLPDDEMLLGDLSTPKWEVRSGGKILVESTDDIRERIGRSPDDGTAVVQAFVPHLGDGSPGTVRKWAGAQELDGMGVNEETKAQRRMREIAGRAAEGLDDAPWDLDGFGPQDEQDRPVRGNVRSWR